MNTLSKKPRIKVRAGDTTTLLRLEALEAEVVALKARVTELESRLELTPRSERIKKKLKAEVQRQDGKERRTKLYHRVLDALGAHGALTGNFHLMTDTLKDRVKQGIKSLDKRGLKLLSKFQKRFQKAWDQGNTQDTVYWAEEQQSLLNL